MNIYTISTLGSHSALQILKGAKDEGFPTLLFAKKETVSFYQRFSFIDEIVSLETYPDVLAYQPRKKIILIPHGSFVAYLGEHGNQTLATPYFGNRNVLKWEGDRHLQMQWFHEAKIRTPKIFAKDEPIDRPVIIKSYGAAGGSGYMIASSQKDFANKIKNFKTNGYLVQEYIVGVPIYLHFFYSPLTKTVELLSIDRRYETNADALGRISQMQIEPSFVVVGNSPLVLRESLLPEAYSMAEKFIEASKKLIDTKGMFGPFCLETIVTPDQKFYCMEASCRIVAGTNLFVNGSPYAALYYDEPMSTGRRIAREIKKAIKEKRLKEILD